MIRHLKNKHGFSHDTLVDLKPAPAKEDVLLQEEVLLSNSASFSKEGAYEHDDSTGSAVISDLTPEIEIKNEHGGLFYSFERDLNDEGEELFKQNLYESLILQIPLAAPHEPNGHFDIAFAKANF